MNTETKTENASVTEKAADAGPIISTAGAADPSNHEYDASASDQEDGAVETTLSPEAVAVASSAEVSVVWQVWEKERRALGLRGREQYEGGREKLKRAVAMAALEIVHRSDHDWKAEAEELGLEVPKSDHPYMVQVVVTFGAPTDDPETKQKLAKFLDRQALAVQWVVNEVTANPEKYTASDEGISALVDLLDEQRGITAVSMAQRQTNSKPKKGSKVPFHLGIALDAQKMRDIRVSRARKNLGELADDREIHLGFVYEKGDTQKIAMTISSDEAQIEEALLTVDVTDPLIDQAGELLQAGAMIAEELTDKPRVELDDPENPESGFRPAYRHFTFGDGDRIVVSPILAAAGIVMVATPHEPMLPERLNQLCHFRTRERRIMEANIADPSRRAAFSGQWGDVGDTAGVLRFVATTQAACDVEEEQFSVLIEPLRSREGNFPLDVHLDRFAPQFRGKMSPRSWRVRHAEFVAKAIKAKKGEKVEHHFKGHSWKITAMKKDDERDIRGMGTATVAVMDIDFVAVSKTIADLPVQDEIEVKADRNTGICLSFRTRLFSYIVVIPARTTGGGRNASLFSPFVVPEE
ncbi:hypothetical protein VQ042_24660 [Aurantimonas sp. A2-1-M11]|uniref:hypothetical protein n=1 Tax=Aurantimonas sp. A2-1-M11 TaxID=3113712 RepID=UPI002F95D64D